MKKLIGFFILTVTLVLSLTIPSHAANYEISWWTVDGGGYTFSEGGSYKLGGTIGQPDAGGPLSGGSYSLVGGFWAYEPQYLLYMPILLKNF